MKDNKNLENSHVVLWSVPIFLGFGSGGLRIMKVGGWIMKENINLEKSHGSHVLWSVPIFFGFE